MVENVHLSQLIGVQASKSGSRVAIMYRDVCAGFWHEVAWGVLAGTVRRTADAFLSAGVEQRQKIMIYAENMPECIYTSFGAYMAGITVIPVFATLNVARLKYIIDEAEVRYVFVGEQQQYDNAFALYALCPSLVKLIIFNRNVARKPVDRMSVYFNEFLGLGSSENHSGELARRMKNASFDDIADLIYTSGTTGESKGVAITYGMYHEALRANNLTVPLKNDDIVLDFLPLSHIFERAWAFFALAKGCTLALNLRPSHVHRSIYEIRPTAMCVVPHFWEKIYEKVLDEMEKSTPERREMIKKALRIGHERNVVYIGNGKEVPEELEKQYKECEKGLFAELKSRLGLERSHLIPTAGATVPAELEDFVRSCGFGIIVGYGLTETTATVSCDDVTKPRSIGSVGRIIDGLEIKFGDKNEILLRGKTITPGYFHRTDSTQSAFHDGWFHTGDAGYIKDGELFLTGRIKDLYKTSNGKYVAPQILEAKLCMDLYINQVVIEAEQRKFVSALIVPDYIKLEEYAYKHKIRFSSRRELCENEQICEMMAERIEMLQQELAGYEKVKRFVLLSRPFDTARGELTATLKVCRKAVREHYADEIENLYRNNK